MCVCVCVCVCVWILSSVLKDFQEVSNFLNITLIHVSGIHSAIERLPSEKVRSPTKIKKLMQTRFYAHVKLQLSLPRGHFFQFFTFIIYSGLSARNEETGDDLCTFLVK